MITTGTPSTTCVKGTTKNETPKAKPNTPKGKTPASSRKGNILIV